MVGRKCILKIKQIKMYAKKEQNKTKQKCKYF